jgi:hypothetical protein
MALLFPSNPIENQIYTAPNGTSYYWNGFAWMAGFYDPAITGDLTLSDNIVDEGTAAYHNVPVTGNAAADEVVMGNDTRLTNSRTPLAHNHDTQYYTEGEVDTLISTHTHTGVYAPVAHNHDASYSASGHNHDATYYTESEIDGLVDIINDQFDIQTGFYTDTVVYNANATTTITLTHYSKRHLTTVATGPTTWAVDSTLAITDYMAAGGVVQLILEISNGIAFTQNWPASWQWDTGTAPDLTAGTDIIAGYSINNGAGFMMFHLGSDMQ